MMAQITDSFDKYEQNDAYHWNMTDSRWNNGKYNPPTVARFQMLEDLLDDNVVKVLDIGCGDGYLLHRVGTAYPDAELYGIDTEEHAIKLADDYLDEYRHNSTLSQGSAYELPFGAEKFDTVLMTEVIEHLEDPELALSEANRVLRNGGTFLVTTPNQQPDIEWDPEYHVHEFTQDELEEILERHFSDTHMKACCPMSWMRYWRSRSINRSIVRAISRLGYNPMLTLTDNPSPNFGQLLAKCVKK
jgi:2-polyprenyl-3-methyl-5-hydroxy-6-metoxy-1,4-benzoquinol methylase